jgi:CDGSH-type Zn-finger protein
VERTIARKFLAQFDGIIYNRKIQTVQELIMSDAEAHIAQRGPFPVQVEAGKDYWWCACGRSKSQPFCDGSHQGSGFTPVKYTADKSDTVYFCGCKHSNGKPLCDGSHNKI